MTDLFYLQDSRSYVGDGLQFWAIDSKGYVTDIDKAELFTKDQACRHRDTDIPWPKSYIDARARVGVDCQCVTLSDALGEHPGATEFYIQKPQAWNGNNLIWLDADGGFTSDLLTAAVVPASQTIAMIGKLGKSGAVVWPKPYIDAHARRLVERDDVDIKEALLGTGIILQKPERLRRPTYRCGGGFGGCGRFLRVEDYYTSCPHCDVSNAP